MGILWIVIIGFVAGIIARLLSPGPNKPAGFILTTVLGIVGAFVATFIGQAVGWYRPDQGAGFIAATVGAIVVLFIWNRYRILTRAVGSTPVAAKADPSAFGILPSLVMFGLLAFTGRSQTRVPRRTRVSSPLFLFGTDVRGAATAHQHRGLARVKI